MSKTLLIALSKSAKFPGIFARPVAIAIEGPTCNLFIMSIRNYLRGGYLGK